MTMTDDELSALRAAAEAATPGPWDVRICNDEEEGVQDPHTYESPGYYRNLGVYSPSARDFVAGCGEYQIADAPNFAYIAAANPATILRLLAHVDALTRERDIAVREKVLATQTAQALTAQVAERDVALMWISSDPEVELTKAQRSAVDALLGGER